MQFIFDVAELAPDMGKSRGIYNYALNLFKELVPLLPPDVRMLVTCNAGSAADFVAPGVAQVEQHVVLAGRTPGTMARQRWIRWGVQAFARRHGVKVYFTPKGFLPGWWGRSAGLTTVAVLHDLIPLWYADHHPDTFGRLERWVVNGGLLRCARWADELVVISQATAGDVHGRTGRPMADMHVIYNGIPLTKPGAAALMAEPYIFAVTSGLPHKNARGLLDAYARYRQQVSKPLPLVVCGLKDPLQDGVIAVSGLDDATLHAYYRDASLMLFLSLIEGFGFPPLEAMAHGTPVLCADIPSLREVTGGAAALVDPLDAAAVADRMVALLADAVEVKALASKGPEVLSRYSWAMCAQQVWDVLRQASIRTR
ncbi:glycosyltransferase family 4 protein [Aquabacterium sp.]|uniref:glycosyltransferase family 4 protein n=1 Tax=Aquabacterium sp. TaxID=1872578 RepID=UPI0035B46EE4